MAFAGNPFYVVGYGFGTFDEETDPKSYNLVNPVRRDTVSLLPLGWTAIRVSPGQSTPFCELYESRYTSSLTQSSFFLCCF